MRDRIPLYVVDQAQHAQDDGFHEIQLNGKQLVFVFMAATLLSVVIFLCGVLVGRGVQRFPIGVTEAFNAQPSVTPELDPAKPVVPPTVQPGTDPTRAIPQVPSSSSDVGSAERTRRVASDAARPEPKSPPLSGTAGGSKPAAAPPSSQKPAASESPALASAAGARPGIEPKPTATTGDGPLSGSLGWVVQVASVDQRSEAETIAQRLSAKGYSTFVLPGALNGFRVRVRGFASRSDADAAAARLRREERIEPWVTR